MRRRISVSKYETSVVDVCPAERESVYRGKAVPSMRAQRAGVSSRSLEVIDSGRPIPMTFSRMAN